MQNFFNYTTLSTRLEKSTRTLFVTLNRPDWQNAFHQEMLFELEGLFAWCTNKVEINSIFIDSSTPLFSPGLDFNLLSEMSAQTLEKINSKMLKIIFAMAQLPQTIIIDAGEGTQTLGSEFLLGGDLRISSTSARISFDHGHYGLIPSAGGLSFLEILTSPSHARNWVLTGMPVERRELLSSGLIAHTYEDSTRSNLIEKILRQLSSMAPVQRIQAKMGLFENIREKLEKGLERDKKISRASMVSEDWKKRKSPKDNLDFMPAKSMSYSVKLSLIKNEGPGQSGEMEH